LWWLAQQVGGLNAGVLVLTATATGGGLWFVVRLMIRYQRDFTESYAKRIVQLEDRVKALEADKDVLSRRLVACASERGALRAMVRQAGIEWNPADWGAVPDGG
jgi:hypothetical protein